MKAVPFCPFVPVSVWGGWRGCARWGVRFDYGVSDRGRRSDMACVLVVVWSVFW